MRYSLAELGDAALSLLRVQARFRSKAARVIAAGGRSRIARDVKLIADRKRRNLIRAGVLRECLPRQERQTVLLVEQEQIFAHVVFHDGVEITVATALF